MNAHRIAYWATTGFLAFNILSGGLAELAQRNDNADGMVQLGYPIYFMLILGAWKVLGTMAILAPRLPRLKEWAYAGIVFNMTGAAVSHAVVGDAAWHVYYTGFLAVLAVASWALRPHSRTLGVVLPARSTNRPAAARAAA
ncbi:MAG TPA: DoxX family protein [Chloroflexota bacterium]|nr:DoxX family protein [Chloroflexota bacterium]